MNPQLATLVFALGIWGLFILDRDRKARTSFALWIPVVWLLIAGSRMVSVWLESTGLADTGIWYSHPDQYLEGSPIDRNVFTVLLILGLIVLASRRKKVGRLLRANVPILVFFAYCALSIIWSDYPSVAFKRWFKGVGDLVMVLVVLTDPDGSAALKRFLARVGFLLVPLSILLIKFYGDLGRGYDSITGWVQYTGVALGKNLLGTTCMIWGVGAVWSFLQALQDREQRRLGRLVAQGTLLAMTGWLFWRADAMTSTSCFLIGSILVIATSRRALARRPLVVHLLVAILLAVPFVVLYFGASATALQTMGRDATLTGRTEIWDQVIAMAPNRLFGAGYESFWLGSRLTKMWQLHWWHPNEAHNGYIEIYLNLGWVGIVLLAIVVATGYRNVIAALRRDRETGSLRLAYFVIALVFDFTESAIKSLSPVWIFFLLATMAVPKTPVSKRSLAPAVDTSGGFAEEQFERELRPEWV
jgi:exopolysaccharide production protein ExoQ